MPRLPWLTYPRHLEEVVLRDVTSHVPVVRLRLLRPPSSEALFCLELRLSILSLPFRLPQFRPYVVHPDGRAASDWLASNRTARINAERRAARVQFTSAERRDAREQRRIDREQRQIDEFTSAASVYDDDELHLERF